MKKLSMYAATDESYRGTERHGLRGLPVAIVHEGCVLQLVIFSEQELLFYGIFKICNVTDIYSKMLSHKISESDRYELSLDPS